MLAGDGADQEESDACAFDPDGMAAGHAVEAFEDAFELRGQKAEAAVGDGECDLGVAHDGDGADNMDAAGGVLDGVVEDVEDGGAQVFCDAADVETDGAGDRRKLDGFGGQMVALERDGDAIGDQGGEFEDGALVVAAAGAEFAGFEYLLDGAEEAVGVGEHDFVELLALRFGDLTALESLEVEADGGDGSFELVGDGVEEGILALVAAQFADQEDGVEDDSADEHAEEDDSEDQREDAAFVEDDVTDVEVDGDADEDRPKGDGKGDGATSSGDVHRVELSIERERGGPETTGQVNATVRG